MLIYVISAPRVSLERFGLIGMGSTGAAGKTQAWKSANSAGGGGGGGFTHAIRVPGLTKLEVSNVLQDYIYIVDDDSEVTSTEQQQESATGNADDHQKALRELAVASCFPAETAVSDLTTVLRTASAATAASPKGGKGAPGGLVRVSLGDLQRACAASARMPRAPPKAPEKSALQNFIL